MLDIRLFHLVVWNWMQSLLRLSKTINVTSCQLYSEVNNDVFLCHQSCKQTSQETPVHLLLVDFDSFCLFLISGYNYNYRVNYNWRQQTKPNNYVYCQLAFEIQRSHVSEKCNKLSTCPIDKYSWWVSMKHLFFFFLLLTGSRLCVFYKKLQGAQRFQTMRSRAPSIKLIRKQ